MKIFLAILLLSVEAFALCNFSSIRKKVDKVDVVYTWVDGSDPDWQAAFQQTKNTYTKSVVKDAQGVERFRNRDELKYSLRSIHRFAPFVTHIYIVTFNQRPSWLADHPMITVVDHRDIFLDAGDLPTFNSQAIEANLHHIHGLNECYMYFNDDVFLGAPVSKRSFFSRRGKPKLFLASWITPEGFVTHEDPAFEASWKNTNALLNRLLGPKKRRALEHAPFVFRRSLQKDVEACLPALFRRVSSHKFRSPDDFVLTAGFCQYLLEHYKLVFPSKIDSLVVGLKDDLKANKKALAEISKQKPITFCIEDAMQNETPEQNSLLRAFFENYYPEKAPWEK